MKEQAYLPNKAYTREEVVAIFGEPYITYIETIQAEPGQNNDWSTERMIPTGWLDEYDCNTCVIMKWLFSDEQIQDIENIDYYPWDEAFLGYFIETMPTYY